jgi:hypothetical protein
MFDDEIATLADSDLATMQELDNAAPDSIACAPAAVPPPVAAAGASAASQPKRRRLNGKTNGS